MFGWRKRAKKIPAEQTEAYKRPFRDTTVMGKGRRLRPLV